MATAPASTDPRREAWQRLRQLRIEAARRDCASFCELVLKDERTNQPVVLSDMHREWFALADTHDRLVLWAFTGSGKTSLLSVGRTLWLLGRNPSARIAILSSADAQSTKIISLIADYIKRSPELKQVFPHLRPAPGGVWRHDALEVERPTRSKDRSVESYGQHSKDITGSRVDYLIVDDVLSWEGTRTEAQRLATAGWFDSSTVLGRLDVGAKVLCVTTAWSPADLMHELARRPGWASGRFGVENETGAPRWPEKWGAERIAKKRAELGHIESARQLDCLARSDEDARFRLEWIDAALRRGRGKELLPHILNLPPSYRTVVGVDLGVSQKAGADLTAVASVLVHPGGDRQLVGLEAGRWTAPDIIARIEGAAARYQATSIVVENAGQQDHLKQMLARRPLSAAVLGFKTGGGKMSLPFQSEQLAVELANARWILPSGDDGKTIAPEVQALARDLLYYSPASHTPDRLSALLMARHGCERGEVRAAWFNKDAAGFGQNR